MTSSELRTELMILRGYPPEMSLTAEEAGVPLDQFVARICADTGTPQLTIVLIAMTLAAYIEHNGAIK